MGFTDILKNNANSIGDDLKDFVLEKTVSNSNYLKTTSVLLKASFSLPYDATSEDVDSIITRIFWGKLPTESVCCAQEKECCKEEKAKEVKEEPRIVEKKNEPSKQEDLGFSIPTPPKANSTSEVGYEKPKPPKAPKIVEEDSLPPPPEKKNGGIRDVQMLAIQAMMKLRKINYDALVSEAFKENNIEFDSLPAIEALTEEQALEVIRYGNNKFKKQ